MRKCLARHGDRAAGAVHEPLHHCAGEAITALEFAHPACGALLAVGTSHGRVLLCRAGQARGWTLAGAVLDSSAPGLKAAQITCARFQLLLCCVAACGHACEPLSDICLLGTAQASRCASVNTTCCRQAAPGPCECHVIRAALVQIALTCAPGGWARVCCGAQQRRGEFGGLPRLQRPARGCQLGVRAHVSPEGQAASDSGFVAAAPRAECGLLRCSSGGGAIPLVPGAQVRRTDACLARRELNTAQHVAACLAHSVFVHHLQRHCPSPHDGCSADDYRMQGLSVSLR